MPHSLNNHHQIDKNFKKMTKITFKSAKLQLQKHDYIKIG